jgi:hypothetical protein
MKHLDLFAAAAGCSLMLLQRMDSTHLGTVPIAAQDDQIGKAGLAALKN